MWSNARRIVFLDGTTNFKCFNVCAEYIIKELETITEQWNSLQKKKIQFRWFMNEQTCIRRTSKLQFSPLLQIINPANSGILYILISVFTKLQMVNNIAYFFLISLRIRPILWTLWETFSKYVMFFIFLFFFLHIKLVHGE